MPGTAGTIETWHRIGTNRWVNESMVIIPQAAGTGTRNMVPHVALNRSGRITASPHANVRSGPGTRFSSVGQMAEGTDFFVTHTSASHHQLCTMRSGTWFRIGTTRWVHSSVARHN